MIDTQEFGYAIAGFVGGVFAAFRAIRKRITKRWYDHALDVIFSVMLGYILSVLFVHYLDWNQQFEYILTAVISSQSHHVFTSIEKLVKYAFGDWLEKIVKQSLEKKFDVDLDEKNEK